MKEKINIKLFVDSIFRNKKKIFQRLESRIKDLERYFYIKSEYKRGNIKNNLGFQCVYRQLYGMNTASLTDDFFKEYFELLAYKETDLKIILSKLFKIPRRDGANAVQFVFATKLLHTIDNNLPIYDSLVGEEFELEVDGENTNDRIDSCIKTHDKLKQYHKELLNNKIIKNIILSFRVEFNCDKKKISDAKVLDFLIWAKGQI